MTSFFLLIALFLLLGINRNGRIEKPLDARLLPLTGFVQSNGSVFRAVESRDKFHALAAEISLTPNTYYHIGYHVPSLPRQKVVLFNDFYAPGYDNSEQELSKPSGMHMFGKRQSFVINSGRSPHRALFRLFYSGSPGLEVAHFQITRIPSWWIWLKRGLIFGVLGALLLLVVLGIQRFRNIRAPSLQGNVKTFGIPASEVPKVMIVYFSFVLIRYIMFMVIPYWSGDEYVYKSIAAGIWQFGRHGVLTDSMVSHSVDLPNLLYPYLISPAFYLGENFYSGVRLINAILINLAIFPCYLIARKFLNPPLALIAATFSLTIPFSNLGAFAVPEVLFYPFFLLCAWMGIESLHRPTSVPWISASGVMCAILLNVRLNALVLMPAFLVSFLWISLRHRRGRFFFLRPYWLSAVIAFLATHMLLQYLLGVRQIGNLGVYSHVVERTSGPLAVFLKDPAGVFHLFVGHFTTIAIPYALPIALVISAILSARNGWRQDSSFEPFLVITSVFAAALFLLTLAFTISVSSFDLGGLGRWHSRYYFYFYPLLSIAGLVIPGRFHPNSKIARWVVIVIVGFFLAANIYFIKFHHGPQLPWFGSIADNMDVQWYLPVKNSYWLFLIFTVILTNLWLRQSPSFRKAFVVFIFSWAALANYGTMHSAGVGAGVRQAAVQLIHANDTTLSAPCGSLAYNFLDHHPGRFVVVGDSYSTMVTAAFWNPFIPERTLIHSDTSKPVAPLEVGVPADYLIANGDIRIDSIYRPIISIGKCVIYEIPNLR
jgi:hypothetical protein